MTSSCEPGRGAGPQQQHGDGFDPFFSSTFRADLGTADPATEKDFAGWCSWATIERTENARQGEGTEMHQVSARHEIIREWRSLPKQQRQTDEQAVLFAMQIKDKYKFSSESADPFQTVKGWLLSYRSLTRGLE